MLADDERERERTKFVKDFFAPCGGTFGTRLEVARFSRAWIAKSHRENRHAACVVKRLAVKTEPVAQAVAAGVVEGNARGMHFAARGLPGDEDACGLGNLQNRSWSERHVHS